VRVRHYHRRGNSAEESSLGQNRLLDLGTLEKWRRHKREECEGGGRVESEKPTQSNGRREQLRMEGAGRERGVGMRRGTLPGQEDTRSKGEKKS